MKRVLVTGASGFIGRQTLNLLKDKGFEVHAFSKSHHISNNYMWYLNDLFDYENTYKLIRQISPTHLLHLAWDVSPNTYWNSLENYQWVQASLNLIQNFHKYGGKRVVIAGSCAEYDWSYGYLTENKTPLSFDNPYAASKNSLQQLISSFAESAGMSFAWGRIFWLYGPYENGQRLIPSVIKNLLLKKEFVCKNGNATRDYLHVYDAADAFVQLLLSDVEGIFNIGSGSPIRIKDIVYKVAELVNQESLIRIVDTKERYPIVIANTEKLINEIKWSPRVNNQTELSNTIEWWRHKYENQH